MENSADKILEVWEFILTLLLAWGFSGVKKKLTGFNYTFCAFF